MTDKLRLFETVLKKAEFEQNYMPELQMLLDRHIFAISKITLQNVFDICKICDFKIKTYSFRVNPYPGVDLEKFLKENNMDDFNIPFFEFLRKFTKEGNYVSINEEYTNDNFYAGKLSSFVYLGEMV